ncbi:MAG TPA: HAD family hydrolase [Methanomassiliicoccales archaeon]|nr:HAD family hydrolase [Methanomassiliicoccales archaeon]
MRSERTIKAVIFDLDNTLVESQIDYLQMKSDVLEELVREGVEPLLLDPSRTIVENVRVGKEDLSRKRPSVDLGAVDIRVNALLTARELERVETVRVHPGVSETLQAVRDRGMRMAVLTRGSRTYAMKVLSLTGLDGRVGPCVCRDDYPLEEAKPNPLAMRRAASKMGLSSEECLYVGDHPMDLECARASGAIFVGVLTGSTDLEKWHQSGCEAVIASVADLPSFIATTLANDT